MTDELKRTAKITVTFEERPDGGLRAYSDDVPGFVLSHSDPQAVMDDVKPALEAILSEMLDAEVVVDELNELADVLDKIKPKPKRRLRADSFQLQRRREYVSRLAA